MSDHLDLVLRVLDHQIVGHDGRLLLGNVDDLELSPQGADLAVTGLATGPPALARRLPGRLGSWTGLLWHRLRPEADPPATVIPIGHVTDVGSAIRVDQAAARGVEAALGLEHWLAEQVISRIPGSRVGGEEREAVGRTSGEARETGAGGPRPDPGPLVRAPLRDRAG